ncbi:hypothetical protein BDV93DRAFT_549540 [Ceratobasidium sp. AG-I]|nr:hypothetical protein BDV93DRAFT_549540 [Ceratobasidium sp. AG-I]
MRTWQQGILTAEKNFCFQISFLFLVINLLMLTTAMTSKCEVGYQIPRIKLSVNPLASLEHTQAHLVILGVGIADRVHRPSGLLIFDSAGLSTTPTSSVVFEQTRPDPVPAPMATIAAVPTPAEVPAPTKLTGHVLSKETQVRAVSDPYSTPFKGVLHSLSAWNTCEQSRRTSPTPVEEKREDEFGAGHGTGSGTSGNAGQKSGSVGARTVMREMIIGVFKFCAVQFLNLWLSRVLSLCRPPLITSFIPPKLVVSVSIKEHFCGETEIEEQMDKIR